MDDWVDSWKVIFNGPYLRDAKSNPEDTGFKLSVTDWDGSGWLSVDISDGREFGHGIVLSPAAIQAIVQYTLNKIVETAEQSG